MILMKLFLLLFYYLLLCIGRVFIKFIICFPFDMTKLEKLYVLQKIDEEVNIRFDESSDEEDEFEPNKGGEKV